jgi:DNA polymerase/3'-5' exonuclease PolX
MSKIIDADYIKKLNSLLGEARDLEDEIKKSHDDLLSFIEELKQESEEAKKHNMHEIKAEIDKHIEHTETIKRQLYTQYVYAVEDRIKLHTHVLKYDEEWCSKYSFALGGYVKREEKLQNDISKALSDTD